MKLIVGLGNPGKDYEKTRHNTGFLVIDELCKYYQVNLSENKFKALFVKFKTAKETIILCKPQTYMNNSGEAVKAIMNYFKIDLSNLLVITDDLDLPVGKIRFRHGGNDGGQKGIRSISSLVQSKDYDRCRIGIGNDKLIPTADYVLGKVEKENRDLYQQTLNKAMLGVINWIHTDIMDTMNRYNGEQMV